MSILEELYNGNICPAEKILTFESEYYKISRSIAELEAALLDGLPQEKKERYEEIIDQKITQDNLYLTARFVDGFRLGAQIMLEILTDSESQLISR